MKSVFPLIALCIFSSSFDAKAQKKKTHIDSSKTGIVVGTISLENMRRITSGYYFFFTNDSINAQLAKTKGIGKKQKLRFKNGVILDVSYRGRDFVEDDKCFYVFRIEKPIGRYNFYEIELFRNTGYMVSTAKGSINHSFEIEEKRVKYIGELNFNEKKGLFKVLNHFKIDSIQILKKYPELDLSDAQ